MTARRDIVVVASVAAVTGVLLLGYVGAFARAAGRANARAEESRAAASKREEQDRAVSAARKRARDLENEADEAGRRGDWETAEKRYREAASVCAPHGELQQQRRSDEDGAKNATARGRDLETFRKEWEALKKEYEAKDYFPFALMGKFESARNRHGMVLAPWCRSEDRKQSEIETILETLRKEWTQGLGPPGSFLAVRKEIGSKYLVRGSEDFGAALRTWKEFKPRVDDPDAKRVTDEIRGLRSRAYGEWTVLKVRLERMQKAEALKQLKEWQPRFEGTSGPDSRLDLEKEIRDMIVKLEK